MAGNLGIRRYTLSVSLSFCTNLVNVSTKFISREITDLRDMYCLWNQMFYFHSKPLVGARTLVVS